MTEPQPKRLISRDTHTTELPRTVVQAAIELLATGSIQERLQAAQLLAGAYAEDEARRLAAAALREQEADPQGASVGTAGPAGAARLPPPGCGSAGEER